MKTNKKNRTTKQLNGEILLMYIHKSLKSIVTAPNYNASLPDYDTSHKMQIKHKYTINMLIDRVTGHLEIFMMIVLI